MSRHVLALAALTAAAAGALAGPLDPPPGPVAPTMKTLVEVEPRVAIGAETTPGDEAGQYRITQPGSYYLTGNITGESGKSAIVVDASNVTIDLSGFTLTGVAGSIDGIVTPAQRESVVIRDGAVRKFSKNGIHLFGKDAVVENVQSHGNGDAGFRLSTFAVVRNCIAKDNSGAGFLIPSGLAESCIAIGNGGTGISIGYTTSGESMIRDSYARNNYHGFNLSGIITATRCTATYNQQHGFNGGVRTNLESCFAGHNGRHGIQVSADCRVESCDADGNAESGIEVIQGWCVLRNNRVSYNARSGEGAGILVRGSGSRIEANEMVKNGIGLRVTGPDNLIVRNSVYDNVTSGYSVGIGNSMGPIVSRFDIFTNDNPHANYAL